jgi:hypothetical protein
MSVDFEKMKRRRTIMFVVSMLAGICAMGGLIGYLEFHQTWLVVPAVAAVLVGFGSQIWFIAGLRGPSKGV